MKRHLYIISLFSAICISACLHAGMANAQDTIVLKSHNVIFARDIRKTDENVIAFYRQGTYYESIDTNTYTVKKNRVAGIIHHDGHVDKLDTVIMNSYIANRHKGHTLYDVKDFKSDLKYNSMPEPPSFTIMWNPTLFLSNNLAFSFEYKKKKNAVELELGYIYPFFGPPYSAYGGNTLDVNFPTGCYNGISANIFLKRYWRQHFYYGLSALFKYEYFKNTWIEDGNNVYSYDVNCSQTREVFGLAFRCGWRFAGKYITWVPYLAGGVRLLNSKTTYNYFTEDGGKGLNYGLPPDDGILFDDNGIALVPYINFGIKVGFGWNGKK